MNIACVSAYIPFAKHFATIQNHVIKHKLRISNSNCKAVKQLNAFKRLKQEGLQIFTSISAGIGNFSFNDVHIFFDS